MPSTTFKMLPFGSLITLASSVVLWVLTVASCSLSGMVMLGLLPMALSPVLAILWWAFAKRIASRGTTDAKSKPKRWPGGRVSIVFGAVLLVLASWHTGAMTSEALQPDIQSDGRLLESWSNHGIMLLGHAYVLNTLNWWAAALIVLAFGIGGSGGSMRGVLLFVAVVASMFPAIVITAREIVAAGAPITA